jgi:hypothetical protein
LLLFISLFLALYRQFIVHLFLMTLLVVILTAVAGLAQETLKA